MDNSLKEYREENGLSQRALAEHVAVTRQTINAVEGDRYDPSVELVFKLAAFFEVPVEDLFHPDIELETSVSETTD
ncbi:helix-turn-helix transcriptional regulator [Halorhabdus amylolytica]|uniref:helix-turn-helix transcriptional regulator n=1 Tax=Halorhabdus amylolytica TaxID=2559573 RepID=UPI0010AA9FE9|nr:helix-turn-helix transcriptional regulator [Halorhabdus amylolytica]